MSDQAHTEKQASTFRDETQPHRLFPSLTDRQLATPGAIYNEGTDSTPLATPYSYHHHHPDTSQVTHDTTYNRAVDLRLKYQPGVSIVRPVMIDPHGKPHDNTRQAVQQYQHKASYDSRQVGTDSDGKAVMQPYDENDDIWHFDPESYPRAMTFRERFMMKANDDPLVPIGCALTLAALSGGLWSFMTGRRQYYQKFMWARVSFQGITLAALFYSAIKLTQRARQNKEQEEKALHT